VDNRGAGATIGGVLDIVNFDFSNDPLPELSLTTSFPEPQFLDFPIRTTPLEVQSSFSNTLSFPGNIQSPRNEGWEAQANGDPANFNSTFGIQPSLLEMSFPSNGISSIPGNIQLPEDEGREAQGNDEPAFNELDNVNSDIGTQTGFPFHIEVLGNDSSPNLRSQSPTGNSRDTTTQSSTQSNEITAERVQCDIEGCGRVCKDHKSLK
jgi:hypothetical protein